MALPLELEPLNLELNPKIYTADLRATLLTWGPIVADLSFLYGPSFVDLFCGIWSTDEQAHGPTPRPHLCQRRTCLLNSVT